MIIVLLSALTLSISHAKIDTVADKIITDCERILEETRRGPPDEETLIGHFLWLEQNLLMMAENKVPKTEDMRRLFDVAFHQLFGQGDFKNATVTIRRLSDKMRHFVAKATSITAVKIPVCINDLIEDPRGLNSDVVYKTGSVCEVAQVEFWPDAVKDMHGLHVLQVERFLKAIKHGWARMAGNNGIKRMPDVHPNFVEVKDTDSAYRLIGCVDGPILTIKRVVRKSDNSSKNFHSYADLCK